MTQDLGGRLPDLLRFAVALCGDRAAAQGLLRQALHRAADEPAAVDLETAVTLTRVWVVRGFLSDGMQLGAPAAADVDQRVPAEPGDPDDLDSRFARLSKLGRTVMVLRFGGGLPVRDIARTVGSTADGIARYLTEQLAWLGVAAEPGAADRPGPEAAVLAELIGRSASLPPGAEFDDAVAEVRDALPARFAAAEDAEDHASAEQPADEQPADEQASDAQPADRTGRNEPEAESAAAADSAGGDAAEPAEQDAGAAPADDAAAADEDSAERIDGNEVAADAETEQSPGEVEPLTEQSDGAGAPARAPEDAQFAEQFAEQDVAAEWAGRIGSVLDLSGLDEDVAEPGFLGSADPADTALSTVGANGRATHQDTWPLHRMSASVALTDGIRGDRSAGAPATGGGGREPVAVQLATPPEIDSTSPAEPGLDGDGELGSGDELLDLSGLEQTATPPSAEDLGDVEPDVAASTADGTVFHEIVAGSPERRSSADSPAETVLRPARPDSSPVDDFGAAGPVRTSTRRAVADPQAADNGSQRSGSHRVLLAFALVVVLAAAIIIGVLATHQPSAQHGSQTHRAAAHVPRTQPIGHSLPGTIGLGTWHGSGNDVISPPVHQVKPGRELALTVLCSGSGPVTVGPVVNTDCSGSVTGSVDSGTALRLQVSAPSGTSWQFDLVDQPQSGTDGALVELPNAALTTPPDHALGSHKGSGSADVSLARPGASGPGIVDVRIVVTCIGDGLTISSADGSVDNQYTRTCFSGWSYEFDATSVRVPTTLHVTADPKTTWHLVAVPF